MSTLSTSAATAWRRFSAESVRLFRAYANWLVGISWKRFFLLSLLLIISSAILGGLLHSETITETRDAPAPPLPPPPVGSTSKGATPWKPGPNDDVTISINKDGVRITPRPRDKSGASPPEDLVTINKDGVRITPPARGTRHVAPASDAGSAAGASAAAAASATPASAAAAPAGSGSAAAAGSWPAVTSTDNGVEIKLPPGATSDAVRQAVEEARAAVLEAIEDSRQAARDAEEAAVEAADASRSAERQYVRIRKTGHGPDLPPLAFLFIVVSAILKITYKGRIQAEVKAAVATETAEAEALKRQVVEARMAAMQAQVEPHFLFNTLASIDHLIETDPKRATQMQKNLIALLRASMPTMRENHPAAHNLGREMAVIRPYLEILKVRMEERLRTEIDVPEGLASADFPSMMIQSLVENAIKHGLEPKPEGGVLSVRAEVLHGKLAVTVADTGMGFGQAATAGTGVGLTNIRERLQLLYGNRASMTVAENTPSGTRVTLTVPYLAQPREGEPA